LLPNFSRFRLSRATRPVIYHPGHRDWLESLNLTDAEAFLALPGPVISGHPDRHVRRVQLGSVTAYLKCEHRVPLRDRLRHLLAGFGRVSKSLRERQTLADLEAAGLPAPPWLAAGEDAHGRAFLLIGEVTGAVDLRPHLAGMLHRPAGERRRFARELGEQLARLHDAGFDQPELSAKHVLVTPGLPRFTVIDWQNSGRRGRVGWHQRVRALAMLDATVADELASQRDRLRVLRAYCRALERGPRAESGVRARSERTTLRSLARRIRRRSIGLLQRRTVREARLPPVSDGSQHLHWLDGEALCTVPPVAEELSAPRWRAAVYSDGPDQRTSLTDGRTAFLIRRHRPHRRSRRRADELRQAGLLFYLQRRGVPVVPLLAFGQRGPRSFLMTERPDGARSLTDLAAARGLTAGTVRAAAALLGRLHASRCHGTAELTASIGDAILLGNDIALVGRVEHLRLSRRPLTPRQILRDRLALLRFVRSVRGGRA
jgi:hypothetical protein